MGLASPGLHTEIVGVVSEGARVYAGRSPLDASCRPSARRPSSTVSPAAVLAEGINQKSRCHRSGAACRGRGHPPCGQDVLWRLCGGLHRSRRPRLENCVQPGPATGRGRLDHRPRLQQPIAPGEIVQWLKAGARQVRCFQFPHEITRPASAPSRGGATAPQGHRPVPDGHVERRRGQQPCRVEHGQRR